MGIILSARRKVAGGALVAVVLSLATSIAGCSAIPGLAPPASTPTASPTNTTAPSPTATSTPTPTRTATPTSTPTPAPFALSVQLEPSTVPQGQIATLVIRATQPASVTATLQGKPLPLFEEQGRWYGLIGIWAGTQPASWPLVITGESAAGSPAIVERRQLRVSARQFEIDAVTMTQDTLNLVLDTEATQRENNLLASLLAPRTPDRLWQGTFQRPVKGEVTTTYGQRRSYNGGPALEYHGGLDLAADEGTPIAAANSGRVVFAGPLKIRGNVVIIDHGWGLYSGYFHMSAIQVTVGQQVERGQTIGLLGSTGFSTGPHVHWQVWLGGYPVDPTFLEQWQLPG